MTSTRNKSPRTSDAFQSTMQQIANKKHTRLVHALDLIADSSMLSKVEETKKKALSLLEEIHNHIAALKINYPLTLATDLRFFESIRQKIDVPIIADFKVADIGNTAKLIAEQAFTAGADAIIVHAFVGTDPLETILKVAEKYNKGVIAVTNMSHPSSKQFITPNTRALTEMCVDLGVSGIIAPATRPTEVQKMRDWVGNRILLLTPGIGAQGGQPGDAIKAGADFEIVGRAIYNATNPDRSAKEISTKIWEKYTSRQQDSSSTITRLRPFVLDLVKIGAIAFGDFTLTSGKKSPYYVDLRLLPSYPMVFREAIFEAVKLTKEQVSDYQCIAGIPTAGISFGTLFSQFTNKPLIYVRKEKKAVGMQRQIEGVFEKGHKALLIDDVISYGGSLLKAVQSIRESGGKVEEAVVLIDRQQGGMQNLANEGVKVHPVITITEIVDILKKNKHLTQDHADTILKYVSESNK
ncbi:MAG: orotidine-5'-phosphate decarboxylase [Candidatus Ranarchaeia archaeon]